MAEIDYTEVGALTPTKVFNKQLVDVAQEFAKNHKPFDLQCARLDFRDKIEQMEKESERRHGYIKVDEMKINFGDLKKYGDESRFELVKEEEAYGDKLNDDGKKVQGQIGWTFDYVCKERGHGISVFIPLEKYSEVVGKKKVSK